MSLPNRKRRSGSDPTLLKRKFSSSSFLIRRLSSLNRENFRPPSLESLKRTGTNISQRVLDHMPSGLGEILGVNRVSGIRDQEYELQELFEKLFPNDDAPISGFWTAQVPSDDFITKTCLPHPKDQVSRLMRGQFQSDDIREDVRLRKSFRVFLASGGSDTELERSIFFAFCAPYLRQLGLVLGVEVEIADNRWGVDETDVFVVTDLRGIAQADFSVVILGDRKLGHRAIPGEIERKILYSVRDYIYDQEEMLDMWFKLDESRNPAVYILETPVDTEKEEEERLERFRIESQRQAIAEAKERKRTEKEKELEKVPSFEDISWDKFDHVDSSDDENEVNDDNKSEEEMPRWSFFKENSFSCFDCSKRSSKNIAKFVADVVCPGWWDGDVEPVDIVPVLMGPRRAQVLIADWEEKYGPIQAILREGARIMAKKRKDPALAEPFYQSVLEAEVAQGPTVGLVIMRDFSIPPSCEYPPRNPTYVSTRKSRYNSIKDAKSRLNKLRLTLAENAQEVLEFSVPWSSRVDPKYHRMKRKLEQERETLSASSAKNQEELVNLEKKEAELLQEVEHALGLDPWENQEHIAYLNELAKKWTRSVERAVLSRRQYSSPDTTYEEVLHHSRLLQDKVNAFTGREALLERMMNCVNRSNTLVVHGSSGKSSLLAKISQNCAQDNSVVVTRFVGTSYESGDLICLIRSLHEQITRAYDDVETGKLPSDYSKVVSAFWRCLTLASKSRPLFLVLAGIDKIHDPCNHCWIPSADKLPCFVTIVVSTKTLASVRSTHFAKRIAVPKFDPLEIKPIVEFWLRRDKRHLRKDQLRVVMLSVQRSKEPSYFFLRLLYQEALVWRSYSKIPDNWKNIESMQTALNVIFDRIEEQHGKVFASRALALLAIARDGLSHNELMDLLSVDSDILAECFEWHLPQLARIPPVYLARFLHTIQRLLVEGHRNLWLHSQYRDAAYQRYCCRDDPATDEAEESKRVSTDAADVIADYFGNKLSVPRITLEKQAAILCTTRQITPQPLKHTIGSIGSRWNDRRLRELPSALLKAQRHEDCFLLLTDPDFVRGMVENEWIDELSSFLRDGRLPQPEFRRLFVRAIEMSKRAAQINPNVLEEQLWGRLAPVLGPENAVVKLFHEIRLQKPGLHARWSNVLESVDSPLVKTLRSHTRRVRALAGLVLRDGRHVLASGAHDQSLNVTDVDTGKLIFKCKGHIGGITCVDSAILSDTNRVFVTASSDVLKIWEGDTGVFITSCKGHTQTIEALTIAKKQSGQYVVCSGSRDETLRVWDCVTGDLKFCISGNRKGVKLLCSMTTDQKSLVAVACGDHSLRIIDLRSNTCIADCTGHSDTITCLCAVSGTYFATGALDLSVRLWDPLNQNMVVCFSGHATGITTLCSSTLSGKVYLASSSQDGAIKVWDVNRKTSLSSCKGLTGVATCMSASEGIVVVGSDDATVRAWDMTTGEKRWGADSHKQAVTCMYTFDKVIVTGSDDASMKVWNVDTRQEYVRNTGWVCCVHYFEISPGRKFVLSGGINNTIYLRDATNGRVIEELSGHFDSVQKLSTCKGIPKTEIRKERDEEVEIQVEEDFHWIFSASEDGSVRAWKMEAGTLNVSFYASFEFHEEGSKVWSVVPMFSAKKEVIATGGEDLTIRIIDVRLKTEMSVFRGHSSSVHELCKLDNSLLSSGGEDGTIIVHDIYSNKKIHSLRKHKTKVCGLSCIQIGGIALLVSASLDHRVYLWNIVTGTHLLSVEQEAIHGISAFFLRNKYWLVAASGPKSQKLNFSQMHASDDSKIVLCESEVIAYPRTKISTFTFGAYGSFSFGCQDGSVSVMDFQPQEV